jgi:hypothetical protein
MVPLVLDLEDSGGAEPVSHAAVGHATEGCATHVEVTCLIEADASRTGVGDGDGNRPAGAGFVAGAFDLHILKTIH